MILNYEIVEFIPLETEEQLSEIKRAKGYNVIFKHNTTCPISKSMRSKFEEEADTLPEVSSVYFLDLLANRNLSDGIEEKFNVRHESPQLLLIKNGECIHNQSLYDISAEETAGAIERS
jgi:bacillithiol system protein YtxJ